MAQPKFTWWPWRILSATVGGLACILPFALWVLGVWPDDQGKETAPLAALSIFAGGNALILGSAIGDFGRTVLALLIGIGVASGFSYFSMEYALLAPFVIMPVITASLSMDRSALGFIASAVLGLGASLIGFMMLCLAWLLIGLLLTLVIPRGEIALVSLPFACAAGNLFLVGFLFNAAHRVKTDQSRGGVEDRIGEADGAGTALPEEPPSG